MGGGDDFLTATASATSTHFPFSECFPDIQLHVILLSPYWSSQAVIY
jgi:hypothetical protein